MPPPSTIARARSRWQPMASMVTVCPLRLMRPSRRGKATISFSPSSTPTVPTQSLLSVAQAFTTCRADLPSARSIVRRKVLPSMAMCSPPTPSHSESSQAARLVPNSKGTSRRKTRPSVSWDGMPCGSLRNSLSQDSWASPQISMCTQVSAPASVANNVSTMMSCNEFSLLRSSRGSGISSMNRLMVMAICLLSALLTGLLRRPAATSQGHSEPQP